jgi:murein DD-endopeptidase MepM/ murein hydrolase activator NlpD
MTDEPLKIENGSASLVPQAGNEMAGAESTGPAGENQPGGKKGFGFLSNPGRAGIGEASFRLGTHVLLVTLVLIVAWVLREVYQSAQSEAGPRASAFAAPVASPTPTSPPADLPVFLGGDPLVSMEGIERQADLHTDVPSRPRLEVSKYIVEKGDTVFGIAEKFGIKPETVLWANQFVLGDNPHNLRPGQELNILPVDGTYHRWSAGDGLNGVAKFFGVSPEVIVDYSGNQIDPASLGDYANPNIEPGTWLVVPGGTREFVNWSAPAIPLDNPQVAAVLGTGACEKVSAGAVGAGVFVWPANNHFLSGFDYRPEANHNGIDVDGDEGAPVYAADNGVIVYAGWNNWGYGNVVVINHGNGWQTLYAHLSAIYVSCGQSVYQTNIIGAVGNTGNSSGPHLHFEMMYNGTKVNPHDYLP